MPTRTPTKSRWSRRTSARTRAYTAPDGFYSKPLWQRSLVILAGPVMSFVFGYVVFCLMGVTTGIPTGKALNKVAHGGAGRRRPADRPAIGDVITAINGQPITDGKQMIDTINGSLGKPITLTVRRGERDVYANRDAAAGPGR